MTRGETAESVRSGTAPRSNDSKAVLVCPSCYHESTVRGDWLLIVENDRVLVCCPDCWTQLTERPRHADQGPEETSRAR